MSARLKILTQMLTCGAISVQSDQQVWPPFLKIGNLIENIFLAIPHWGIKVIIIAFFVILAITPFFFSKDYIFKGADDRKPWRDLRYWALAAVITEIMVYLYF
jgi:hypothetical protein